MRGLVSTAACLSILLAGTAPAGDPEGPHAEYLRAAQITPDRPGIAAYLESLLPSEAGRRRELALVDQLGSPSSRARDAAMSALLRSATPPIEALEDAAAFGEPEVRARAQHVLRRVSRSDPAPALHAALRLIEVRRMAGMTDLLLRVADQFPGPIFRRSLTRTLVAAAGPDDAETIRSAAASDEPRRFIAIPALPAACGAGAADELVRLCADTDEHVRFAAAQALAFAHDRRCLGVLVDLLDSPDVHMRCEAGDLLTRATGRQFGYAGYADREMRAAAALAWRTWVAEHGDVADLRLPADAEADLGRILICVYAEDTLRELDADGEVTLNVAGFDYLWGCQGLPNGHRLAVDAERRTLCEYDLAGQCCWRAENLPGRPTSVQRLPDGNTLIASSDGNLILELDPTGAVAWQLKLKGRPTTAQRLANGLTLVNLQDIGRVVEVDRDGKVHWSLDGLARPHTAQALENGNVLVCDMRREEVVEYDRAKRPVWEYDDLVNPAQAQRLANGNTLIADEQGLHEINSDGRRVWHHPVSRARFHRY